MQVPTDQQHRARTLRINAYDLRSKGIQDSDRFEENGNTSILSERNGQLLSGNDETMLGHVRAHFSLPAYVMPEATWLLGRFFVRRSRDINAYQRAGRTQLEIVVAV
jgi:hypothetical protein